MLSRFRIALTAISAACAVTFSLPSHAIGALADITVVDRATGQTLPVHQFQGRYYVAGRPGARYGIRAYNQSGERLMAVMSVDGVNVVSGETANWEQNGYVFGPWQRFDVTGWRKSQAQVAAFEFTALANSYAARTGRPDHVGVIGVALFRERRVVPPPAVLPEQRSLPQSRRLDDLSRAQGAAESGARNEAESAPARDASASAPRAKSESASAEGQAAGPGVVDSFAKRQPESKLGTGHGRRESSWVEYTQFQRAQSTPDEMIVIHYDSRENLVAQGVLPPPRVMPPLNPSPFPGQPAVGFVPDPPRNW